MKTMLMVAALFVSSASFAVAATPGELKVKALDTDKDNFLTREEVKSDADLTARFTTLDTNKDGKLDAGEIDYSPKGMDHGKNPSKK